MSNEEGCIGLDVYINEDAPNVILLLFAEDVAIFSDMPGRLQHNVQCLEFFCDKSRELNLLKTKILVLRRDVIAKRNEK